MNSKRTLHQSFSNSNYSPSVKVDGGISLARRAPWKITLETLPTLPDPEYPGRSPGVENMEAGCGKGVLLNVADDCLLKTFTLA